MYFSPPTPCVSSPHTLYFPPPHPVFLSPQPQQAPAAALRDAARVLLASSCDPATNNNRFPRQVIAIQGMLQGGSTLPVFTPQLLQQYAVQVGWVGVGWNVCGCGDGCWSCECRSVSVCVCFGGCHTFFPLFSHTLPSPFTHPSPSFHTFSPLFSRTHTHTPTHTPTTTPTTTHTPIPPHIDCCLRSSMCIPPPSRS